MNDPRFRQLNWLPWAGCAAVLLAVSLMCMLPIFLVEIMTSALARLHLSEGAAALAVVGIFLGSLFNIPLYHLDRPEQELLDADETPGNMLRWPPGVGAARQGISVAINVGGGVIPTALALWQIRYLANSQPQALTALAVVAALNIFVCYRASIPVRGIGIMMPGFLSPLVAVLGTWLILPAESPDRVPVAFVAGVLGPLVGADLLHLKDIGKIARGTLSIGGAGTFDGIVLSGVLAALLA
jgi:uncharacterized membrane protein